jgi:hypothetical protein
MLHQHFSFASSRGLISYGESSFAGNKKSAAYGEESFSYLAYRKSKLLYAALAGSRDSGVILEAFKRALADTPVNSIALDNGSWARMRT